jgi:hypothetical protein
MHIAFKTVGYFSYTNGEQVQSVEGIDTSMIIASCTFFSKCKVGLHWKLHIWRQCAYMSIYLLTLRYWDLYQRKIWVGVQPKYSRKVTFATFRIRTNISGNVSDSINRIDRLTSIDELFRTWDFGSNLV